MLPSVAGLATAVPSIVGGVVGKVAHDKYAKLLEGLSLDLPSQYDEARGIYQKLAATGLPGVDQAKLDLMGNVPSTLKAYQSVVENPASIMGALTDVQSGVNEGLTDLSIKDALAKVSNMQTLGAYMQQEGAVQGQYDQYNNQLTMSAGAERMAGTAELLNAITGGTGGGISAYGNMQMANDMSAFYNPAPTTPAIPAVTQPVATPGPSIAPQTYPSLAPERDILKYLESLKLSGAAGSAEKKSLFDLMMGGYGSSFAPVSK